MRIGVIFPQTEIGGSPEATRDHALTAEDVGYDYLLAYDHVLGVAPDRDGWEGSYDNSDPFQEPFALFSHLAALTEEIAFATGILILPQRQTALVAKQAATVDVLSGGRLRLGVGVGWNPVEFEALSQDFSTRGRRIESQIALLRKLWTNEVVTVDDEFHRVDAAGLNPRPVQRPIPIWMGGSAPPVLRRTARLADGWMPPTAAHGSLVDHLDRLREHAREAGRDPDELDVVCLMKSDVDDPVERAVELREAGATHVSLDTMGTGLEAPGDHADAIRSVARELRDAGIELSKST